MQGLVYIFIALAALGVAGAAYFGLTFSPIEAFVTAIAFGAVAVMLMERRLRERSESRLQQAIEDLARLLSTDTQAGEVLSKRVNAIADTNVGNRLEGIEADISVLGTVVRQVAEAVAELEESRRRTGSAASAPAEAVSPDNDHGFPVPAIPLLSLARALDENRLIFHIEPIVVLPQRRPYGYDLVPRLMREAGELADAPDFMPLQGGEEVIRRIEAAALEEAVVIARRARTAGQPIRLYVPLGRASALHRPSLAQTLGTLGANQAIAESLVFAVPQADWKLFGPGDKRLLQEIARTGVGFALIGVTSLRLDFAELEGMGFTSGRFDASRFLDRPEDFTDFHSADIAPYAQRFRLDLCATGVGDEQQLLSLFEDGILHMQGPHIGRPGPVRPDLLVERAPPQQRRVEA